VFLAVDHSKFGRNAMVKLGTLADVDLIITDQPPPKEIASFAKEHEVTIQVA